MVKQIIRADPTAKNVFQKQGNDFLRVSEFYYDTIQGEGHYIGFPAAFLRLQGCNLRCCFCDTEEVWKHGNPYSFDELFELINGTMLVRKLKEGQHLVLTGGSPLLQQDRLLRFLLRFFSVYRFIPFIEIENECTIEPESKLFDYVSFWNNSPKLSNSMVPEELRFKPKAIKAVAGLGNSWFKFVISKSDDWNEIVEYFIHSGFIRKEKIILMPEGSTREELENNRMLVLELAVSQGVRYSTREHIILWDKRIGI